MLINFCHTDLSCYADKFCHTELCVAKWSIHKLKVQFYALKAWIRTFKVWIFRYAQNDNALLSLQVDFLSWLLRLATRWVATLKMTRACCHCATKPPQNLKFPKSCIKNFIFLRKIRCEGLNFFSKCRFSRKVLMKIRSKCEFFWFCLNFFTIECKK